MSLHVGVDLEASLVQRLGDVFDNSVVSERPPALFHRDLTRGKQVTRRLEDAAAGERTLVSGGLPPLLEVGVGRESVKRSI